MRNVMLIAVMLSGCAYVPKTDGPTEEQKAIALLQARVDRLTEQVGVEPTMPDLAPLIDRVEALEAAVAVMRAKTRVPHLIAYAGTAQEFDIGVAIGPNCALRENGTFCNTGFKAWFETTDCTGIPYLGSPIVAPADRLFQGIDGNVWKQPVTRSLVGVVFRSQWSSALGGDQCVTFTQSQSTAYPMDYSDKFPYVGTNSTTVAPR